MAKSTDPTSSSGLRDHLVRVTRREREIEAALAAHLVAATRPSYQRQIERYLRDTARRVELLEGRHGEERDDRRKNGAADGRKRLDEATQALKERAAALAGGGVPPELERANAERLLEIAREEQIAAVEQVAAYGVVAALAKAAGDKKTVKLARECADAHEEMADYVGGLIPKLAKGLVEAERAGEEAAQAEEQEREEAGDRGELEGEPATGGRGRAAAKPGRSTRARASSSSRSSSAKRGSSRTTRSRRSS